MALALLFEDESVIILDAVTQYSKTRNSSISKHPIDKSAVISDHVAKDNPVFSIRAVVSSADFHSPLTRNPELLGDNNIEAAFNTPVNETVITANDSLLELLPGSIGNIIGSGNNATVEMDSFRGYSHVTAREKFLDAWDKSELVTILDYDYDFSTGRSIDVKQVENCLIRNFEDIEDVDTGDALNANFTFERIRFAYVQETDIAEQPDPGTQDPASPEESEGDQSDANGLIVSGQDAWYVDSTLEQALQAVESLVGGFFD